MEAWPSCLDLLADIVGTQRGEKVGVHRTASPPRETKPVGVSKVEACPWRHQSLWPILPSCGCQPSGQPGEGFLFLPRSLLFKEP